MNPCCGGGEGAEPASKRHLDVNLQGKKIEKIGRVDAIQGAIQGVKDVRDGYSVGAITGRRYALHYAVCRRWIGKYAGTDRRTPTVYKGRLLSHFCFCLGYFVFRLWAVTLRWLSEGHCRGGRPG